MPTPTTRAPARRPAGPPSLAARKALLEAQIEQQRFDVLVEAERWTQATRRIDACFHAARRFKAPLYGVAGVLIWRSLRRPKGLRRLAGRAFGMAMAARRLRRIVG